MQRKLILWIVYSSTLLIFWLNAEWLVEWLNRSLFAEYTIFEMKHETSFTRGASFIFLFFILFYALFGNVWMSLLITNGIFLTLTYANQVKVMTRNEYITYKEMLTLASPKEIFMLVDITMKKAVFYGVLLLIGMIIIQWGAMYLNRKLKVRLHRWARVSLVILSLGCLLFIYKYPQTYIERVLKYESLAGNNFNPVHHARYKGYVPTLIDTMDMTYLDRPTSYNKGTVEQIVEKYTKKAETLNEERSKSLAEDQTIFYLSETLIAPNQIPNFETGEPIMPRLTDIMERSIAGGMYSQYIGGGTANIEWSVLTSFSLEAFNDHLTVTPYADFYTTVPNHSSLLSFFNEGKIAIHPYTAGLYKRTSVFEKMGFNDFLYIDHGLKYDERFEGHDYINDRSMHLEIEDELKTGARFVHALSMQNHSNYHYTYPFTSYVPDFWREPFEERQEEVENFLKGLRMTDDALPDLIESLEQQPENVNLLLYGDHFPNMFNGKAELFSKEVLHRTPWFLYMNHGRNQMKKLPEISPIFFASVLLKEGDYYVSPFQVILTELYEAGVQRIGHEFIIQNNERIEKEQWSEEVDELLTDYFLVMYDALFGSNYATSLFYEEWK